MARGMALAACCVGAGRLSAVCSALAGAALVTKRVSPASSRRAAGRPACQHCSVNVPIFKEIAYAPLEPRVSL